jgi:hypothetical protein
MGVFSNVFDPFRRVFRAGMSGAGGAALSFLARYEFPVDVAAPITSPYTEGNGSLNITDSANVMPIASGLHISARTGAGDPKALSTSALVFAPGTCLFAQHNIVTAYRALTGIGATLADFSLGISSGVSVNVSGVNTFFATVTFPAKVVKAVILGSTRTYFLLYDGTNWKLWYAGTTVSGASARYYGVGVSDAGAENEKIRYMRLCQLAAPWVGDYDTATARVAIPGIGETITSEANACQEMTWTAVTGQTWNFIVRRVDDSNCVIIRLDQGGSTIKVIDVAAGVETELASAAQTLTNGTAYRLWVIQDGANIRTAVNGVVKNNATSTALATATGVKTDRAGTNLIAWPRNYSGAAMAELNKWTIDISPL